MSVSRQTQSTQFCVAAEITDFPGKKEVPFTAVRQNDEGNAPVERILEQLALRTVALANLLHLDEDPRFGRRMSEGEVDASALKGVLGRNNLGVVDRPTEGIEDPEDDTLRN